MITSPRGSSSDEPSTPDPPTRIGWLGAIIIVTVLAFFSVLAVWGVAAATIVAVSGAAVSVLKVILPRL